MAAIGNTIQERSKCMMRKTREKSSSKDKMGNLLLVTGILFLAAAIVLLGYNTWENYRAGQNSEQVVNTIIEELSTEPSDQEDELTVRMIDGYEYMGCLYIPKIERMLPVMSTWDYDKLRLAPCRQYGSVKEKDLVIAAHNYDSHFGRLKDLEIGDSVVFTDMSGSRTEYEVVATDIFMPQDVEKVKDSEWDLILYTCTIGGKSRVVIGCNRV